MIVAVIAVRMVQMSIDQVIDMIAMRDCFVATVWTMNMAGVMAGALVGRRARFSEVSTSVHCCETYAAYALVVALRTV